MNTALPQGLPRRVLIVPSNFYMKTDEALRLISANRAREVRSDAGDFVGIELGHFGPRPTIALHARGFGLPPAELPNLTYRPPTSQSRTQYRNCRELVRMARRFVRSAA